MSKIRCSVFKCAAELSPDNKDVYAVRIESDGWRFVCRNHELAIKNGTLKNTLETIYGPRKEKNNKLGFRKKETSEKKKNNFSLPN